MNEFELEEEEEDRIGDVVSSDLDDSDDDQGGTNATPTMADAMPVPIEVLHGVQAQGRLVTDLATDDTPYDS